MTAAKGVLALMGSGELTATMVEVHKGLLSRLGPAPAAAFLDTPAGFQLNVDQLSRKAVAYFRDRVQRSMAVASFQSRDAATPYEAEQAFHTLRSANFILIGPGSPTYAIRNWLETPIPEILRNLIEKGGCLVAASAAALTIGRFCLPVYEVYKVGLAPHWVAGMNILGNFGFDLAVIPHWNNAEGGTHDTRFCYMGESRLQKLLSLLPAEATVLGLDEHTACLLDFETGKATVKGIGCVTLRRPGIEASFKKGEIFPLDLLRREPSADGWSSAGHKPTVPEPPPAEAKSFWITVHDLEAAFHAGLEGREPETAMNALLELDQVLWRAQQDLESPEFLSQARETFRELIVRLGSKLEGSPEDEISDWSHLVTDLVGLRDRFRQEQKWDEADAIRACLQQANIVVEDTKSGARWRIGM